MERIVVLPQSSRNTICAKMPYARLPRAKIPQRIDESAAFCFGAEPSLRDSIVLKESTMTITSATLAQTVGNAAQQAGITILEQREGTDFHGEPTALFQLGLSPATTLDRSLPLEMSETLQLDSPALEDGLRAHLAEVAKRLRNPRPDVYVTLAGLPLAFADFKWPFHGSTSGADTYIVHGIVRLEDGNNSPLHTKIAGSMTRTFAEVVPAREQPYAEGFIYNAVRKTMDQGQLEMLKSGNRQPVPVTTRYYSRWQNKFIFADSNDQLRREFLSSKVFWLSAVLGGDGPVWIADPRDAQYLNTTPEELMTAAGLLASDGLVQLAGDFATPTQKLHEMGDSFRARMLAALALTKPEFNEEMRGGHTNM